MKAKTTYWPIVRNKVKVIYNGVSKVTGFSTANARLELTRQSPALKAELIHAQKNYNAQDIVWIGTSAELHHIKGHIHAIQGIKDYMDNQKIKMMNEEKDAQKNTKKIIYTIISEGEQRPVLDKLITELELNDTVFLLGYMDTAAQYVKAFDIFLLASLSEGLGYVLLEAGMAGVPCIATAVGGIPEIITDMKSGILIQPQRPKEIAYAIEYLIDNKQQSKQYAEELHKKVFADFSIDHMIENTEALYR